MIEFIRFIIVCLIFLGINLSATEDSSMYIDDLYKDIRVFAEKMNNELGLHTNGVRAKWSDTIDEIELSFSAQRRATIEEARALALYIIEQVVHDLNKQGKYRPYFKESPLSYKAVSLQLSFISPEGRYCDGSVSYMRKVYGYSTYIEDQNMLYYYASDPFSEMKSTDLNAEHYEDAVVKLSSSSLKFPFAHKTTEFEAAMDHIFETYSDEMSQEKQLIRWSLGGLLSGNVEKIGVILTYFQPTHLKQGRELLAFATERLIKAINESEKLKPYLLEKPFSEKRVRMEIRFRNYNYFNFHDDSLDGAVLDNGQVTYSHEENAHHEDYPDLKEVKPFLWESYQEAIEKSRAKGSVN
ncbi:MAG: hypothetical protein LLG04_05255 [Parachlamydia sp.]|nr:hypothetical protein [Parachlamydia sp.]